MGEAVAKINAQCHSVPTRRSSDLGKKIRADMARFVCAERDGHGNRAGTYSKRQGQRIKSAARNVLHVHFFLNGWAAVNFLFAFKHGPAVGDDNQAAAYLNDWNRDSKEFQNVRADEKRGNQEDETVHRDLAREDSARGSGILASQCEKDGAADEAIQDRKQGADD